VSEPIRLLILTSTLGRGGADKQILNLGYHLDPERFRVKIVSMTPLDVMGVRGVERGLDIESAGLASRTRGARKTSGTKQRGLWGAAAGLVRIAATVRRFQPDVLLTFMVHAALLGRLFRLCGLAGRHVSSVRSTRMSSRLFERMFRWTRRLDELTVVNSRNAARELTAKGILDPARTRVIPNGIHVADFDAPAPGGGWAARPARPARRGDAVFTWIMVARIVAAKDYDTLLEAVARLREPGRPFEGSFVVRSVGDGARADRIRRRARELNLEGSIEFLGARPDSDIPGMLAEADAFVLSSAWEGMPNVVMEAAAASLPVVCTDVGGASELVEEGASGFLVPPCNPEALAGAMERMMGLPEEQRRAMGRRGRERMERSYSVRAVIEMWREALMEVTARSGGAAGAGARAGGNRAGGAA